MYMCVGDEFVIILHSILSQNTKKKIKIKMSSAAVVIVADNILVIFFYFLLFFFFCYFSEKIGLHISCKSSLQNTKIKLSSAAVVISALSIALDKILFSIQKY